MFEDELTPAERDALRSLPREAQPGDLLEERTVRALAARGLIRRPGRRPALLVWAGTAAACVVFFAAGFALGQNRNLQRGTERAAPPAEGSARREARPAPEPDRAPETNVATADSTAGGSRYVVWF